MIIGKDEKARLWEKNGGKCGKCSKVINPFNEVVFHAYNARKIEMYCPDCESALDSENMNNDSFLYKDDEMLVI
jgi:hypothetical protein